MRRLARIVVVGLVVVFCPRVVAAAPILLDRITTYGAVSIPNGLFTADNDVAFLPFEVLDDGTRFVAETTSFSLNNGFDPYLALFDGLGNIVHYDDPVEGLVPAFNEDIDFEGGNWDARLALTLGAGSYTLVLAQYLNAYQNDQLFLFDFDGVEWASYTDFFVPDGASCGGFATFDGQCGRTGAFALSVELTAAQQPPPPPAPVPEPATLTLVGIGAAGAALRKTLRRRRTPSSY